MAEKWVTIYIEDGNKRCPESKVQKVLDNIEEVKRYCLEKGAPQETVDKIYSVRIVKDED